MFYCLFKKIFLGFRKSFYEFDKPRLELQVLPKEVSIKSFNYGNDEKQSFNLFKTNDEKKPLLIDLHGGAWIYGDKDLNNMFCATMCQKGYDVISLGYRLVNDVLLKDIIFDIFNGLKYIISHKDELKIDLDKVYLTGDSAGGHLALLVCSILNNETLLHQLDLPKLDLKISAACLNHAVPYTDIAGRLDNHPILTKYVGQPGLIRILYGKNFKHDVFYKLLANPTLYINKDSKLCPILILTSEADSRYYYQSKMLHDYFDFINIKHEFINEKNEKAYHVFNVLYPKNELGCKNNLLIDDFFKSN